VENICQEERGGEMTVGKRQACGWVSGGHMSVRAWAISSEGGVGNKR
jgi:hypothetical protein